MSIKDIGKALLQASERKGSSIARDGLAGLLEHRPQIIDTVAMIGMIMSPDHCINMINAIVEKLVAQVGRGIDQYPGGRAFHENRNAASAVFRFVGIASAPVIADPRYARRSPAPQYGELQSHIQGRALLNS